MDSVVCLDRVPRSAARVRRGRMGGSVGESGLTLLEVTIATALAAVVLAVAAQVMGSFSMAMNVQEERYEANQNCLSIVSHMCQLRNASPDDFPDCIVDEYPNESTVTGRGTLPNETFFILYTDPTANPLEVTITSRWDSMRGHEGTATIVTLLTSG
jgi:type II secretory pathway pseudopilin PulG